MNRPRASAADFLHASVEWTDRTRWGTTLSGRLQALTRDLLYPRTSERLAAAGERLDVDALRELVVRDRSTPEHAEALADPTLFCPDEAAVEPAALRLTSTFTGESIRVTLGHRSLVEIGAALRDEAAERPPIVERLLAETEARARAWGFTRPRIAGDGGRPLFVGHACVTWSDGSLRIWCDPFLAPKRPRYPRRYQPLGPLDVPEREHVVLLTHSHPDHFDPASLLLFPPTTRFIIPVIPRETPLSVNLGLRLRQLGFTAIVEAPWWTELDLGSFRVTALPFFGEQPVGWGAAPIAEYNLGNTYAVRGRDQRLHLLLADSGSDPRGSLAELTRQVRRELGRVDVLFANHRRWALHPPQYLLTSVPHFLCFVPDDEIGVRQQIMLEPEELARATEALGASIVVPYAMGGARWHEELGLGFDHLAPGRSTAFDAAGNELHAEIEGHPGMTLRRAFRPVTLLAGHALADADRPALARGLRLPRRRDFRPERAPPPQPYVALVGVAIKRDRIAHLAALTTLDAGAFVIASEGLCEVYTSPGSAGDFLRGMLARYTRGVRAVSRESTRPLTGAPFDASPALLRAFCAAQGGAFRGLRDGDGIEDVLRRLLRAHARLPAELLARMHDELLDRGRAGIRAGAPRRPTPGTPPALAGIRAARPLIRRFGATAVQRALLVVKVAHNLVETARAWGHPEAPSDERGLLRALIHGDARRPPDPGDL